MSQVTPALQLRDTFIRKVTEDRTGDIMAYQVSADDEVDMVRNWLLYAASVATVYCISPGISVMLHNAAERLTIRRGIAFERQDLFTPYGFAYFERGFPVDTLPSIERYQVAGKANLIAHLWGPNAGGVMHIAIVDYNGTLKGIPIPRFRTHCPFGKVIDPLDAMPIGAPVDLTPEQQQEDRLMAALNVDIVLRSFYTLLHFVRQRFLVTSPAMDRSDRRRYEKAGVPAPDAKIVLLRRAEYLGDRREHETDVEWSHRWIVSGHWRQQWYPSMNLHRAIWINPFVKGPEDKPFVKRERALAVVR